MSDVNIKLMLYRSNKKRNELNKIGTELQQEAMESYIFTSTPNQIQDKVFKENNIIALHNDIVNKEEGTKKFLEDLILEKKRLS